MLGNEVASNDSFIWNQRLEQHIKKIKRSSKQNHTIKIMGKLKFEKFLHEQRKFKILIEIKKHKLRMLFCLSSLLLVLLFIFAILLFYHFNNNNLEMFRRLQLQPRENIPFFCDVSSVVVCGKHDRKTYNKHWINNLKQNLC